MQFTWAQAEDDSPKDEDSGKKLWRKSSTTDVGVFFFGGV